MAEVFECCIHNARWLMRFLDTVKDIHAILDVSCTKRGWEILQTNDNKTILTEVQLERRFFEYYNCPKDCNLVFRVTSFQKLLKAVMIQHSERNVRIYIRCVPGAPKFHFRLDCGIPSERSVEAEMSMCDAWPARGLLPHFGETEALQFPATDFRKIMSDFTGNDDTMELRVSGVDQAKCISFSAKRPDSGEQMTFQLRHTQSGDDRKDVLLSHLGNDQICLYASLKTLSVISKIGANLGPYWEVTLKERQPFKFKLPIWNRHMGGFEGKLYDTRYGTALHFFQRGYSRTGQSNNQFPHINAGYSARSRAK